MGQIKQEPIGAEEKAEVKMLLLTLVESLKRLDKAALDLRVACE